LYTQTHRQQRSHIPGAVLITRSTAVNYRRPQSLQGAAKVWENRLIRVCTPQSKLTQPTTQSQKLVLDKKNLAEQGAQILGVGGLTP